MKGSFVVNELYESEPGVWGLAGVVASGSLEAGMEARYDSIVIIIREVKAADDLDKPLKRARKGLRTIIVPLTTVREMLELCVGKTLEFEDIRSIPVRAPIAVPAN